MKLITVIGLARSGTSWLGKIFASHPKTLYHFEPFDLKDERRDLPARLRFWNAIDRAKNRDGSDNRDVIWKAIQAFWTVKDHKLDRAPFLPQCQDPDATMVIKDPSLVPIAGMMGYFGSVVFIVRDPRAQINSLLNNTRFGRNYGVQASAERWAHHNGQFIELCEELPETFSLVKYEDLCQEPGAETERLFTATGLDMTPSVRAFLAESVAHHDSHPYSVMKDPEKAAGWWKGKLSKGAQEIIIKAVQGSRAAKLYGDFP